MWRLCVAILLTWMTLGLLAQAFAEEQTGMKPNVSVPFSLPASFSGMTPCPNCEGIRLSVTLNRDGTYKLEREYLGREAIGGEMGTWRYDQAQSQLKLFPHGSKTVELFKVHLQPTLEMLDMHGKPIQSANTYLLAQVSEKAAPSEAATVPLSLESVMWRLTQLDGKGITISAGEQPITMMFDAADTRVSGSLGCNRFNGPYERSTSSLHIGLLAVTRMMCIHDVMVTEDAFVKALTATASYAIEGQVLNLYDRSGRIVAQFKAAGTNS